MTAAERSRDEPFRAAPSADERFDDRPSRDLVDRTGGRRELVENTDSYHRLMTRLAELPSVLAAEHSRIDLWAGRQRRAARVARERAENAVHDAQVEVNAAAATTTWTAAETARLWRTLERRVGSVGQQPGPAEYADPADDPLRLLREVAAELASTTVTRSGLNWRSPTTIASVLIVLLLIVGLGSLLVLNS